RRVLFRSARRRPRPRGRHDPLGGPRPPGLSRHPRGAHPVLCQGRGARRAARGRLVIVTHTLASQVTVVGAVHDGPAARMLEVILERESAASVVTFAGDATQAGGDAASTVIVPAARPDLVRAARDSGATVVTAGFTADADVRGSPLEARSA